MEDFNATEFDNFISTGRVNIIPTTADLDASRENIPQNTIAAMEQMRIDKAQKQGIGQYENPTTGEIEMTPNPSLEDGSLDLLDYVSLGLGGLTTGYIGKKGFEKANKFIDPKGRTKFGQEIDALPGSQRIRMHEAVDTVEGVGGTKFDEDALNSLSKTVMPQKSASDVGSDVAEKLSNVKLSRKSEVDELYKIADLNGVKTKEIDTNTMIDDIFKKDEELHRIVTGGNIENKPIIDTYKDISAVFKDDLPSSAARLEEKRKYLTDALGDAEGKSRTLYRNAIEIIDREQDKLLREIGSPDLYKDARSKWKSMKTDFEGKRFSDKPNDNFGASGGAAIKEAIESGDTHKVAKTLFQDNLDPDKVKQISRFLDEPEKRELGLTVLLRGISRDKTGNVTITSQDGINKLLSNFKSADNESLKMLFGTEGSDNLRKSIQSMELVSAAIKNKAGDIDNIGKDVLKIVSSIALFNVSPYLSVRQGVGASVDVVRKKLLNKEKRDLIVRVKNIKSSKVANVLLKALVSGGAIYSGYKAAEKFSNRPATDENVFDKIGSKSKKTLRSMLLGEN